MLVWPESKSQGRDRFTMRRRAYHARWLALLWLLAAQAGCSWIGLRRGLDHGEATPGAGRAESADQ